jgi:hypothetical protein
VRGPSTCKMLRYLAAAVVAASIYAGGPARAGDGGESLTGLNNLICEIFGYSTAPCPYQVPTITQAVLYLAGLEVTPPEIVRTLNSVAPGNYVDAGNAAAVSQTAPGIPVAWSGTPFPLTPNTTPTLSNFLSTLTPLAFVSGSYLLPAAVTSIHNPNADTYLFAVTSGPVGSTGLTAPQYLNLFYDVPVVPVFYFPGGKFSLQLTVLNGSGAERQVPVTLIYNTPGSGGAPCSASTVTGNFSGTGTKTLKASQIGINCALVYSTSPTSGFGSANVGLPYPTHPIFEVQIPILATETADPLYFWFYLYGANGPINLSVPSFFFPPVNGYDPAAGILGSGDLYIGVAPDADPLGPPPTCTGTNCTPPPSTFALCASLPGSEFGGLVPSVGADYVIAVDGETLLSAPIPSVSTSVCRL